MLRERNFLSRRFYLLWVVRISGKKNLSMKIGVHTAVTFFDSVGCRLSHPTYFRLHEDEVFITGAKVLVQA